MNYPANLAIRDMSSLGILNRTNSNFYVETLFNSLDTLHKNKALKLQT